MDLNPSQKRIMAFLGIARADDLEAPEGSASRAADGYRNLQEIITGTGLSENAVRRNSEALYYGLYLGRQLRGRAWSYRRRAP